MWKCPKCGYKSTKYVEVQKHYYNRHHKSSGSKSTTKGKEKKVYTFHPTLKRRN